MATTQQPPVPTPAHRQEEPAGSRIADPAPLGLAAFALTTFILSFVNADILKGEPVVFGLALAYGGLAQLLAGMWEFAKGNTFGATAFGSFGAFWISYWYLTGHTEIPGTLTKDDVNHTVALFLLGWGIFTAYMTVAASRVSGAVFAVFVLLTITFVLLALGDFTVSADATGPDGLTKIGGYFGIATALAAWYASAAGVISFTHKKPLLPTGPRE